MGLDLTTGGPPDEPDDQQEAMLVVAKAIHDAARGAALTDGIRATGRNLKDWSASISKSIIALDDETMAVMAKVATATRMKAALDALGEAEGASDLSDDQRASIAKARALCDAMTASATVDKASPHLMRLEAVLSAMGKPASADPGEEGGSDDGPHW